MNSETSQGISGIKKTMKLKSYGAVIHIDHTILMEFKFVYIIIGKRRRFFYYIRKSCFYPLSVFFFHVCLFQIQYNICDDWSNISSLLVLWLLKSFCLICQVSQDIREIAKIDFVCSCRSYGAAQPYKVSPAWLNKHFIIGKWQYYNLVKIWPVNKCTDPLFFPLFWFC